MKALEINAAAEANMVTHMSWLQSRIAGMHVYADPQLTLIDSGLPTDTFNLVCRARLEQGATTRRISGALEYFREAARPFSWWVGPMDRPLDIGEKLIEAGLVAAESEVAMAADLAAPIPKTDAPSALRIEPVVTAAQIRQFAGVNAANWTPPDAAVMAFYEAASELLLRNDCPLRLYVGYVEDRPVASAEITISDGVAGVYNVATVVSERRKGIGTAMMLRALADVRANGFRTAVLQASRDGQGLYSSIGFEPVGEFVEYKTGDA